MKYHYEKSPVEEPVYGMPIILEKHPIYSSGTLYLEENRGIIVTQQHFLDFEKSCFWGSVDTGIANDIYLSPYFHKFFMTFAKPAPDFPIYQLRKIMWSLRMKPLERKEWEDYFSPVYSAKGKSCETFNRIKK